MKKSKCNTCAVGFLTKEVNSATCDMYCLNKVGKCSSYRKLKDKDKDKRKCLDFTK